MTEDISRRIKYFARKDPSHLITEKNAWGYNDAYSFSPSQFADGLWFRCIACNHLGNNDFLDTMVCSHCGWRIPSKEFARDMMVEAHNVHVGFGGWTPESMDAAAKSVVPVTVEPRTLHTKPVGEVARNMTAWHFAALESALKDARKKASIIQELRRSSVNNMLTEQEAWRHV